MELALGKEDSSKMETHVKALTRETGDKSDIRNPRKSALACNLTTHLAFQAIFISPR